MRQSLDLTNWEAANRKIHEWEVHGKDESVTVKEACEKFLDDCKARNLSKAIQKKYKYVTEELTSLFGDQSLRSISVDDLRKMRNAWKYAPLTAAKRLEYVKTIFRFCVDSGWIQKNPTKPMKASVVKQAPTLPLSEAEWKNLQIALDVYGEVYKQSPLWVAKELRALVLLMRFSGLRISDAVSLKRDRVNASGRLFLYQAKTGHPVLIPLPAIVLESLSKIDRPGEVFFFWSGVGTLATALTHWQGRLKKLFGLAGIEDGHSHRLRDTFSVDLLSKGVPLQTVSLLLGHTSVKTTEKHYAPFVKASADALELAVRKTWN